MDPKPFFVIHDKKDIIGFAANRGQIHLSPFRRRQTVTVTIYHNPRCSKSRQTLELLRSQGHEPNIIEYLKTPPGKSELTRVLALLGLGPRELMRNKETEYKDNGLDATDLSDDQLLDAMIEHPVLIERPIVLANGKAAIGRPPENVLDII